MSQGRQSPDQKTGGEASGNGKGKEPAGGKSSPKTRLGTSVLGLENAPRAADGGVLKRIVQLKDGTSSTVDFWWDVVKFDSNKMEAVLKLATSDSTYDLTGFIRGIEYQGFDRLFFIAHALSMMSVSLFCRFAVLGAIRGSNFKKITDSCETMPQDMINAFSSLSFVKNPSKKRDLTILRCTSSIPHWCAFYMLKADVAKKLNMDCPAALQFPGAASLPMSREVRLQHLNFCATFSSLLPNGTFNMNIYLTAMSNAIPLSDIPQEVLSILKVSSISESYALSEGEKEQYTKAVVVKK
jgi:hypothetical protein